MTISMPLDFNMWYRLTTYSANVGRVLAGNPADLDDNSLPNGYVDLNTEGFSNYDNQYWQLSSQPTGYYWICNCWLGPYYGLGFSLDNTSTYRPALYGGSSGAGPDQLWNITTVSEGVFSLANPFVGIDTQTIFYLDTAGGVPGLQNNTVGYDWLWVVWEVGPINNDTYSSISSGTTTSSPTSSSPTTANSTIIPGYSIEFVTISSISTGTTLATPSMTQPLTSSLSPPPTVDPGTFSLGTPASDAGYKSAATVAGIGAGVSIAVMLFGICVVCVVIRRRRRRQKRAPLKQRDNDDGTTAIEQAHGEGKEGKPELSAAEKKHFEADAELQSDTLIAELQDSGLGELPAVAEPGSNIMSELE